MNYRHSFHAGNFADVFKHIVLIGLLKSFFKKDTPFCYLDTHAGTGLYNLRSSFAQKGKEYLNGIDRILAAKKPPALVKEYIACVESMAKKHYPGSPKIAQYFLRPQDRMELCELHPIDYRALRNLFADARGTAVHCEDGYHGLKAYLPPKEKRGLILIDPPYEKNTEYTNLLTQIPLALKKFSTGVYAIWYPIKDHASAKRFQHQMRDAISQDILIAELSIFPENLPTHLNGSGMLIINPPYQLDTQLAETLPWLWETLCMTELDNKLYRIKKL